MMARWFVVVAMSCGEDGVRTRADATTAIDTAAADASDELPLLPAVCATADGDVGLVPSAAKTPACSGDAPGPLFSDVGLLAGDQAELHALCARMNPAPLTRDDLDDPQLASDLRAYLRSLVDRPPLQRAMAGSPADADLRVTELESVWLAGNGLEHVLCGDLNPNGNVGGLHLWSEYYLAEREGRADYACTVQGAQDPVVAAVRFTWTPPGSSTPASKPLGSFHVGASPACMLALGYAATKAGISGSVGDTPALRAELYGTTREWVLALSAGAIVTLYPHAQ